jgi:hypothetical protein
VEQPAFYEGLLAALAPGLVRGPRETRPKRRPGRPVDNDPADPSATSVENIDEAVVVAGREVHRKTRSMRRGARQEVTGIVVNVHPGIRRDQFDRWKAVLHNCVRFGPASQNRTGLADFRAHLEGVVAWVKHVQPEKGAKLEALLREIAWPPRATPV